LDGEEQKTTSPIYTYMAWPHGYRVYIETQISKRWKKAFVKKTDAILSFKR